MSLLLPLCLVALACFQYADGYSSGAPTAYCGAAGTMAPGHGMLPQSSVIPYSLTANSGQLTYSTGESISLTLAGGAFTGFLIQALSASTNTVVGTMTAPAGSKVLSCGGSGNNGLTHANKDPKTSFSFQWEGPDTTTSGAVTFLVTVVQDYSTYWVRQQRLTLTPATTVTTPSAITSETGQTTASQLTVTPLPQTTVVSSSASSPLTTKPSSQVTSNNQLDFANAPVTRTDIYTPHYSGHNAPTTDSYHATPHKTDHIRNYSSLNTRENLHSSFYHTTAVGQLKENNNVATTTDSYSFHNTASIAAYFNSNTNEENNFTNSEIYHKIITTSERIYETTLPSVRRPNQTPTYFNTVDYQKVAYSTGRFENVNHRTKDKNSDILSTHIGKLPRNDSLRTENNVFTIKVNETQVAPEATTFSFQTFNVFNNTENIQGAELDNWINNNEINFTNGALDKNKNYTLFEILREPHKIEPTGILNKLKETREDSLRITELPLSDPDRIFDVAKQILQKDNTRNLQFKQVIELLRNDNNESDTLITDYRTSTVSTEHINIITDDFTKSQEASTVTMKYASETTPALLTNTHLSNTNTGKHDNNKNVITYNNSESIKETTLSQWDISTTQPTVTIQGGSRSTTLKEIVSKWMREHVHDIPDDQVSTPTSNNQDVSKGKDGGDSKVNETNNIRNLDFHFPELEVINVDCQRRTA